MLYIHIKLSPRVTLPQIWGLWPIIQDLKNRPVLLWDLVFGYKTVNISLPDGLGGWFGWPPGVLQITHPMGPSTHPSARRGSKRAKTSPSLEPFLGQCATLELCENLSRKYFLGQKKFWNCFGVGPDTRRDLKSFSKVSHFFSCHFFKRALFRQMAANHRLISVKNFLSVWIFKKCQKKLGKCISHTGSLPDVFLTFWPLIWAVLLLFT